MKRKKILAIVLAFAVICALSLEPRILSYAEENITNSVTNKDVEKSEVSSSSEDDTSEEDENVAGDNTDVVDDDATTPGNDTSEENEDNVNNDSDTNDENDLTVDNGNVEKEVDIAEINVVKKNSDASTPAPTSEEIEEELPNGDCGTNLTWRFEKNSNSSNTYTLIIEGSGDMDNFTAQTQPWQADRTKITKVVLPQGLTSIGEFAFASCSNLQGKINIPDGVTKVGKQAFAGTQIEEVVIPGSMKLDVNPVFSRCSKLTKIRICDGVSEIGTRYFNGCTGLTMIELPASITNIENMAFASCQSLKTGTVYYKGSEEQWKQLLKKLDENNTKISNAPLVECEHITCNGNMPETKYSITISDKLNGTVKVDKTSASRGETVTVSQTPNEGYNFIGWVIRDPASTEELCSVTGNKFIMPEQDVQVVAWYASNKCGTTWDGADGSNLTWRVSENKDGETYTLVIEGSGTMGGYQRGTDTPWYMYQNKITAISLPDGLLNIGSGAFEGTKISKINIPDSVTNIAFNSFLSSIYLTEIKLPENAVVGDFAFACSALRSIKVPANAMSDYNRIDSARAFYASALLEKAELCEGITYIPEQYFGKCSSLKEVIIPASVTSIDKLAFGDCNSLETVYYRGTKEQWEELKKNTIMGLFGNDTYKTDNQNLFNAKKIVFNYVADNSNNGNNGGNNTTNNTQTSTGQKGNGGAKGSAAGKAGNTAAGGSAAQAGAAARTGDTAQVGVLFGLLLVSGAVLLCIAMRRRVKRS